MGSNFQEKNDGTILSSVLVNLIEKPTFQYLLDTFGRFTSTDGFIFSIRIRPYLPDCSNRQTDQPVLTRPLPLFCLRVRRVRAGTTHLSTPKTDWRSKFEGPKRKFLELWDQNENNK